ncbi:MAG TPA: beta-ketoacyl-[acyl-carrier-protein] synthase II [Candidatus Marinimicrobia bacterium]|nr:beta-ketoacyl-[acyl-carrier-protein] synthase II [Candidatus Neomarinimicrobiota bacterium]|tara:strand:- start:36 stop:1280 length:1245 start_codon:yes stop_codon:yes gene_type:complete
MKKRRAVVTGIGVLAPNGNSLSEYWDALIAGKSGIGPIQSFDAENLSVRIAGELSDFNPEDHFDRKEIRRLDPFSIYALVTSHESISHSGLDQSDVNKERVSVIIGTGVGGIQTLENQHGVFSNRGQRRVTPYFVPKMISNIAAGQIAIHHGFQGPNHTVVSACASGTDAIGTATRIIQYGDADVVVTGGVEASITGLCIAGFANMKALSTRNDDPTAASRPFDANRDGFVLGEGAASIILEEAEHARSRGATILAEVAGYGSTDDAFHITQPSEGGKGAIAAMQLALTDAQLGVEDVDYINAHGTSTPFNDKTESAAITTLFGEHAQKLKVSSTKSMIGHSLGASGALEAAACVQAIYHNMLPPTINYNTPDPECTLDYVPNTAQEAEVNVVMSNSFGFGGHNGVIVLKRWVE